MGGWGTPGTGNQQPEKLQRHSVIPRVQQSQPEQTQGQAAVKGYTEQPSFAFGVAMTARNLQTKADLEKNSVLGPKSLCFQTVC